MALFQGPVVALLKTQFFCLILEKADMQLRNPLWENSHRVQLAVYLATHLEYFVSIYFDKGKMGNKYFALSCKFSHRIFILFVKGESCSWKHGVLEDQTALTK